MTESNEDVIERIVAGVVARLREAPSGAAAGRAPEAPRADAAGPAWKPAAAAAFAPTISAPPSDVVSWPGKVLTLSQLEALGVPARLAVSARAIVTPSALDLIKERRVELLRGLPDPGAAAAAAGGVRVGLLDAGDGVVTLAAVVKRAAAGAGVVAWTPLAGDPYTESGLAALGAAIAGGQLDAALVCARLTAVAACRLARLAGVVPLIAERVEELDPSWQRLGGAGRPVLILPGAVAAPYRMGRAVEWLIGLAGRRAAGGGSAR